MPEDIKTTNIRLPIETWKAVNHLLIDQGGNESFNALIVRLLDEHVLKEQKKAAKK